LEPGNTVLAVQAISPALKAELSQLWLQGANAKWRKDYAGARRAWTKMLQLRPGHPGVQSAIDKLPR
jgi:cytochrome c-type biogenesis protein CcmH/NrfG